MRLREQHYNTLHRDYLAPNKGAQPLSLLALQIHSYYLRQLVTWSENGVEWTHPNLSCETNPLSQQRSLSW
jgi:hypothetical protein